MSVVKYFFLGILAAFFSLILEVVFSIIYPGASDALFLSYISPILFFSIIAEESFKFIILFKNYSPDIAKKNVLANSLIAGTGFASTEIFFYVYQDASLATTSLPFLLGILLLHIFTSVFIGSLLVKNHEKYFTASRAITVNAFIHLLYNLAVLYFF